MVRDYPKNKMEQECLLRQICSFRGITEQEMIDSLYFTRPDGERVQTSGSSDKTAMVALNYKSQMARINEEWYDHLEDEYLKLTEELRFFESAVLSLPGIQGKVFQAAEKFYISRRTVGNYRAKAIEELTKMYENREAQIDNYMLG